MIDIIKNPVIIGLLIGIIVYLYLKWENETEYEQTNKKNKKMKKPKEVNLLIPLCVGVACWFIAHNYFDGYDFMNGNDEIDEIDKIQINDVGGFGMGNQMNRTYGTHIDGNTLEMPDYPYNLPRPMYGGNIMNQRTGNMMNRQINKSNNGQMNGHYGGQFNEPHMLKNDINQVGLPPTTYHVLRKGITLPEVSQIPEMYA